MTRRSVTSRLGDPYYTIYLKQISLHISLQVAYNLPVQLKSFLYVATLNVAFIAFLYIPTAAVAYLAYTTDYIPSEQFAWVRFVVLLLFVPIILKYVIQILIAPAYAIVERVRYK